MGADFADQNLKNKIRIIRARSRLKFLMANENIKPTVMKFGGTSVQDAEAFARVAEIVAGERANSPVVVTSAMSKVTDALLAAFDLAKKGEVENAVLLLD